VLLILVWQNFIYRFEDLKKTAATTATATTSSSSAALTD
jgi:hypothetical protein